MPVAVRRTAAAITLFEVAISLAMVATCVTSLALLFPVGIATQNLARYRLYAAAKAVDLVEAFNAVCNGDPCMDIEAFDPWDVPADYGTTMHDIEPRIATRRYGVAPLPMDIARRLDSTGDEIARILDEGGRLYYAQANAATGWWETALPRHAPPNDIQRLVFAVDGHAQSNALFGFPWKSWPYHTNYPSPPMFFHHRDGFMRRDGSVEPDANRVVFGAWGRNAFRCYLWEETNDPDIRHVFQSPYPVDPDLSKNYGYFPYAYPANPYTLPSYANPGPCPTLPDADWAAAAVRYVQATLWYCQAKGLPSTFWTSSTPMADFIAAPDDELWQQVTAMRFLAHATACLTRWYPATAVIVVPSVLIAGDPTPATTITGAHIAAFQDSCKLLAQRFCARFPYDWAVPRSMEQSIMNDYPLLEADLFGPPLSGPLFGEPSRIAKHWRPLSPQPVEHIGVSTSYPSCAIDPGIWGDARRFSLCAPFAAAERSRQLVFWAVDWQAYVDCETAPSAPIDASKYIRTAPMVGQSFASLLGGGYWDGHIFTFRNPEGVYAFTDSVAGTVTGADVSGLRGMTSNDDVAYAPRWKQVFTGSYGADRDFDGVLDRGVVPITVRMRAISVGRFNFYDPRVPCVYR